MSAKKHLAAAAVLPTRRQLIAGAGMGFASLAASTDGWNKAQDVATDSQSMDLDKLRTYLHQEINLKASAERIYAALLNSKQFTAFTGLSAEIEPKEGGSFSMFGGLIVGRNVELIPSQRIVQAWRPTSWDPGVYSIVKFEFKEQGLETRVVLDHTGFPEGKFVGLDSGWHERYWNPLMKYFA